MRKSANEVIVDLEIPAIQEKLKHTSHKANKAKIVVQPTNPIVKQEAEDDEEQVEDHSTIDNNTPVRSPSDI